MKILSLKGNLCIITDSAKCLECGTCIRVCPHNAISIKGLKHAQHEPACRPATGAHHRPILQHLTELLQAAVKPVQLFRQGGTDIRSLDSFEHGTRASASGARQSGTTKAQR